MKIVKVIALLTIGFAFGMVYDHRSQPVDQRSVETLLRYSTLVRRLDAQLTAQDQQLGLCRARLVVAGMKNNVTGFHQK